jgi:hypothetical protein
MARIAEHVYHHTDTVCLPWIIQAAELRPANTAWCNDWPDEDFLWTTVNNWDEPSAATTTGRSLINPYSLVKPRRVRFTLSADDFGPFDREIVVRHWGPQWEHMLHDIEEGDRSLGSFIKDWRVRIGPLPLSRVIRIETRDVPLDDEPIYRKWVPFKRQSRLYRVGDGLCVNIAGTLYGSSRKQNERGVWIYTPIYMPEPGYFQRFAKVAARVAV